MTELGLRNIAALVGDPGAPTGWPRGRDLMRLNHQYGRLAELALWWRGVHEHSTHESDSPSSLPSPDSRVEFASFSEPCVVANATPKAGTTDISEAVQRGAAIADSAADEGAEALVVTLRRCSCVRAAAAELLSLDAIEVNGWPQDPMELGWHEDVEDADQLWIGRVRMVRDGLNRIRAAQEPDRILVGLGEPELAAATAAILRSAARQTPILLDGTGSAVAALLARRYAIGVNQWWQIAGLAPDPLAGPLQDALQHKPLLDLGIGAEDGTSGRLALALVGYAATTVTEAALRPSPTPDAEAWLHGIDV